jgi:iron uptake system component EfeO
MSLTRWSWRALALLAVAAAAACSSGDGVQKVSVTSSATTCVLSRTRLAAGTHPFTIRNTGKEFVAFYVYASGDRVVAEKDNIGPGTRVTTNLKLPAGKYEASCKPGQKGVGIRQKLTVLKKK